MGTAGTAFFPGASVVPPGDVIEVQTTVPAAGFVAVALALGEFQKAAGSAFQLLLNLVWIVVAAVAVLLFYRAVSKRLSEATARQLRWQLRRSRG